MKCPKCGKNMTKDFCMFCGYMLNGNYIHKTNYEVSDLEKALGNDYNKVIRNENIGFIFLIGPLYFAYRNYFFLGFVLEFINIFSYYFLFACSEALRITPVGIPNMGFWFIFIIYFLLNKTFWMTLSNPIYKSLINTKVKKIQGKYPNKNEKDEKLRSIKIRNIYKLILAFILLLLMPIIIVICIKLYFGNL